MQMELNSQPEVWQEVLERRGLRAALPKDGERVAVVGCGTSWFVAKSYAALRESLGRGETDAFAASEYPANRRYDRVLAITRSGTTSEVLEVMRSVRGATPTSAVIADPSTPVAELVDECAVLDFADETSVVQTRFATTALMLLRSSVQPEVKLASVITEAAAVLAAFDFGTDSAAPDVVAPALLAAEQITFVGGGWAWGLAEEAALKLRESSQAWTEAYSSMEYRHGPIAIAAPGRVTWQFGAAPEGLAEDVVRAGARFEVADRDPLAELVRVHAVSLLRSRSIGLDADHPRSLTRSVILNER
ncbi:SIS domain-containing protein [Tsukamurella tyrosinosolvens]|uniref:SIS domain-containing protein n=1 Tax=Tsukamurella tyrosinosolvens TaxID=57704 RepID=UPI001C6A607F|nr:sugar isomerase [Tsukamurella tyrosinosolvens]